MNNFSGRDLIKGILRKASFLMGVGFVSFSVSTAQAENSFSKRQSERKSSRWTLTDWLDTKSQMNQQNMWLTQHVNKVPIDGALSVVQTPETLGGMFDFYMKFLGVRFAYDHPVTYALMGDQPDIGGARSKIDLQLRLFGNNIQNTNIVVRGGVEYDDVQGVNGFNASYIGWGIEPEVQIYFAPFLGAWGSWRFRFPSKPADHRNLELSGNSWKAAAFIEMSALRFEAGFQSRAWNFRNANTTDSEQIVSDSLFGAIRLFY